MSGFSRAEWTQIEKRVKQAQFKFDAKWKCFVCGHKFRVCLHTVEDNHGILAEVRTRLADELT